MWVFFKKLQKLKKKYQYFCAAIVTVFGFFSNWLRLSQIAYIESEYRLRLYVLRLQCLDTKRKYKKESTKPNLIHTISNQCLQNLLLYVGVSIDTLA